MYIDIADAEYVKNYVIWIKFSDGLEGEIDLEKELYGEVFEPLKDLNYFKDFEIHPELRVLSWSNGADFAPEFIYEKIKEAA